MLRFRFRGLMDNKQTVWYTTYQIPGSDEEYFIYYDLVTAEHFRHLEKQCLKRDKRKLAKE